MAVYNNNRRLKIIKELGLPWKACRQSDEILAIMTANMSHCEHFASDIDEKRGRQALIALMMSSAPCLLALEILCALISFRGDIAPTEHVIR